MGVPWYTRHTQGRQACNVSTAISRIDVKLSTLSDLTKKKSICKLCTVFKVDIGILRRPPNFAKSRPIIWLPQYIGQIIGRDFAKFCDLVRIYELYRIFLVKSQFDDPRWNDNSKTNYMCLEDEALTGWKIWYRISIGACIKLFWQGTIFRLNLFFIIEVSQIFLVLILNWLKTERLTGRMCLCALIGCSTKYCFCLGFCKVSEFFLNVPKWN